MRNAYHIDGDVAIVTLTQGKEAIIDVADLSLVAPHRWFAAKHRNAFYAYTKISHLRRTTADGDASPH